MVYKEYVLLSDPEHTYSNMLTTALSFSYLFNISANTTHSYQVVYNVKYILGCSCCLENIGP